MNQVSGPVIAVGLVLGAVFIPCAFISGITGQFYRQFALTIAVSTIISTFCSLTLSPALAALLLRPKELEKHEVLPLVSYPLLGAGLGFSFMAAWLRSLLLMLHADGLVTSFDAWPWVVPLLLAAVGARHLPLLREAAQSRRSAGSSKNSTSASIIPRMPIPGSSARCSGSAGWCSWAMLVSWS